MNQRLFFQFSAALLLLAAFITFRVFVRRDYLQKGRLGARSSILQLLLCGLYFNFPYTYLPVKWPEIPPLPAAPIQRNAGLALVLTGSILTAIGVASLGLRRVFGQGGALHCRGLYRLSRNPQIVCSSLVVFGLAVLWPSWYAMGWLLLFMPIFHMMVLTEEEFLRAQFGEAYLQYRARVPRYLQLGRRSKHAPSEAVERLRRDRRGRPGSRRPQAFRGGVDGKEAQSDAQREQAGKN